MYNNGVICYLNLIVTEFNIKDCKVMYHNNTPRAIIGIGVSYI